MSVVGMKLPYKQTVEMGGWMCLYYCGRSGASHIFIPILRIKIIR